MTLADRAECARRAAADFRRRGLTRFAAAADAHAAELARRAQPFRQRRPMPPGQCAAVVLLRPRRVT